MPKSIYRIVTRGTDGEIQTRDFDQADPILKMHTQLFRLIFREAKQLPQAVYEAFPRCFQRSTSRKRNQKK